MRRVSILRESDETQPLLFLVGDEYTDAGFGEEPSVLDKVAPGMEAVSIPQ